MQEPVHPLTDQERFIRELISVHKEHSVLWDKNHAHYKNRTERNEAREILLNKCREYYPEADEDFVKLKIDSLRACFRKEWNKVCISKSRAERSEDIYKPTLWYYNLLLYTVGEECSEDENKTQDVSRILFWSREYTAILINLFKKHPCLYVNDSPYANLAKRNSAIKKITEEMNVSTGKLFTKDDIKKKIQLLKGQYRFECRKIRERRKLNSKVPYRPNLWCFEILSFLKGHVFRKDPHVKNFRKSIRRSCRFKTDSALCLNTEELQIVKEESNREYEDDLKENYEHDTTDISNTSHEEHDDIFDTIGKHVAWKLRDMTDDQRKYAEKLVNEVMYHGQMEGLSKNSRLSIDGT